MNSYKLRSGREITVKMLHHWEDTGHSEKEIAYILGISRYMLYKIRKKMCAPVRFRSDRGKVRVDPEDRRLRWNAYMREYRKRGRKPVNIRVGDRVIQRCRHNAAIKLGRTLFNDEVVHHIDGDLTNDDIDNLLVFSSQADLEGYLRGEDVEPVMPEGFWDEDDEFLTSSEPVVDERMVRLQQEAEFNVSMFVLGRPIEPGEVIGYIDGDISNIEPENLMVFASREEYEAYQAGEKDVSPITS